MLSIHWTREAYPIFSKKLLQSSRATPMKTNLKRQRSIASQ